MAKYQASWPQQIKDEIRPVLIKYNDDCLSVESIGDCEFSGNTEACYQFMGEQLGNTAHRIRLVEFLKAEKEKQDSKVI